MVPHVSDTDTVACCEHGTTPATFVCRHIVHGVACGFHISDVKVEWPDAWCDLCDEAFHAAGDQWNDASQKVASIRMLCTFCYRNARDRNQRIPQHARGKGARLTAVEVGRLIDHAVDAFRTRHEDAESRCPWTSMTTMTVDPDASTVTFPHPTQPAIIADFRLIGSYSRKSQTFQWMWATATEQAIVSRPSMELRTFGEVRGVTELTTPNRACDESDAWRIVALAGYLLDTEAAHCAAHEHLGHFMMLSNVRHAS